MSSDTTDAYDPVLAGEGASDYERYLRTDELLALQKTESERAHHDELLFQTVHQSSELWLKHACFEVATATDEMQAGDLSAAIRLLRRATLGLRLIIAQLEMLEHMSPWEYQTVRRVLGHGSGFDSPGFRTLAEVSPRLGEAFSSLLDVSGLDAVTLYRRLREFEDLYQLAELLVDWDARVSLWRSHHYKIVERIIGAHVVGTQGTPVELLQHLPNNQFYPWLWEARTSLTEAAKLED
jgi:tryptophan 2,3-dioxygenase